MIEKDGERARARVRESASETGGGGEKMKEKGHAIRKGVLRGGRKKRSTEKGRK